MIHGPMAEAQQGFATLEDVDVGTFLRFVEWLYHGWYHAAEPAVVMAVTGAGAGGSEVQTKKTPARKEMKSVNLYELLEKPVDEDDGWGAFGAAKKRKGKKSWVVESPEPAVVEPTHLPDPKEEFIARRYTLHNISRDHPQPRPNKSPDEDYTPIFLAHARLYVFADKYDIQALKVLAMEELHAVLAVYTLYEERTGDIIALLRYIYAETAEMGGRGEEENLRKLMVQYVETEMGMLIRDLGLEALMIEDGGCLLGDFLCVMRRRLS